MDLFRLSHTLQHGTEALVYSKGRCSVNVSGHNLRADFQWCTLVPPFDSGANAAPTLVHTLV